MLDEQYTRYPFYGVRRMTAWLRTQGHEVNSKRVARLMRELGIAAIYPKPGLSVPGDGHEIYPYLLRDVLVERRDQVWSTDITYIRLAQGFVYLVAVLDWFSRYVLAWELSVTMDVGFCIDALERALEIGARPEIFNSDQGAQFTSQAFTGRLRAADIRISMDGRGRALDNVFVERQWRTVKYEEVYLEDYARVPSARTNLDALSVLQPGTAAPSARLPASSRLWCRADQRVSRLRGGAEERERRGARPATRATSHTGRRAWR